MPATPASGFQLLFLYFAVLFGAMLASKSVVSLHSLPAQYLNAVGQAITFAFAGLVLVLVPSMRRASVALLAGAVPANRRIEIALAAGLKLAIPFGLVGAIALPAILSQDAGGLARIPIQSDPAGQLAFVLEPGMLALEFVFGWVLGPLLEEIYFRGFLYRAWERQWGWLPATILTSVAFGLGHPSHVVSSILASVIFISVMRRTGSLRAAVYAHAAYNVLVFWPFFGQLVFTARSGDPLALSTWAIEIACLLITLIGVPLYLFFARRPYGAPPARS